MRTTTEDGVWITDMTSQNWKIKLGNIAIAVTRHILYPGSWIVICEPFFPSRSPKDLGNIDAETAKAAAIGMVKAELMAALEAVDKAIG